MATFPLRVVFMKMPKEEGTEMPPAAILVSVPKKRFRHAVDRNRMKRMVREAYRTNKHILWEALEGRDFRVALAFVCITDTLPTFQAVNKSVRKALTRMTEKI